MNFLLFAIVAVVASFYYTELLLLQLPATGVSLVFILCKLYGNRKVIIGTVDLNNLD